MWDYYIMIRKLFKTYRALFENKVSDIYGKDRRGKEITIKLACYWEVDNELMRYRSKMDKTSYIDFTSYKALPMDPVNCFEHEQTDYSE